jgi:cation-transporting ATPase 13A3/4/5
MLRIKVHVIRNGLEIIDNVQLVPGDHILIQQNMMIPCDCIIIKGEVMVDEASLTGESVPVPKANVPKNLHPFTPTPSITLYEGTKIV